MKSVLLPLALTVMVAQPSHALSLAKEIVCTSITDANRLGVALTTPDVSENQVVTLYRSLDCKLVQNVHVDPQTDRVHSLTGKPMAVFRVTYEEDGKVITGYAHIPFLHIPQDA